MILGIDVGYSYTKLISSNGADMFLSTIIEGENDINKSIVVEMDGQKYTVGENTGIFSVDMNKIQDMTFRICLYTAIARAMGNTSSAEIQLVTGLPAEYYKAQKRDLIRSLKGEAVTLKLNGKSKKFIITDVVVFPQSAGPFLLEPEKFNDSNTIVIDIGGKTVDISIFDDLKLSKTGTYELGILKLYGRLTQQVKSVHQVSYNILQAERIIRKKEIMKDNEIIEVSGLVKKVLSDHADEIIRNIKNDFEEYNTNKRIYIGGGAYVLKDYLDTDVSKESIFTNAKAFYKIGVEKFEG